MILFPFWWINGEKLTFSRCILFVLALVLRVAVLRQYLIRPRVDPTLYLISCGVTFSLMLLSWGCNHRNNTDFCVFVGTELLRCLVFGAVLVTHWEFCQESLLVWWKCALMEILIDHWEYLYQLKNQLNSIGYGFVQQSQYLSMHLD